MIPLDLPKLARQHPFAGVSENAASKPPEPESRRVVRRPTLRGYDCRGDVGHVESEELLRRAQESQGTPTRSKESERYHA